MAANFDDSKSYPLSKELAALPRENAISVIRSSLNSFARTQYFPKNSCGVNKPDAQARTEQELYQRARLKGLTRKEASDIAQSVFKQHEQQAASNARCDELGQRTIGKPDKIADAPNRRKPFKHKTTAVSPTAITVTAPQDTRSALDTPATSTTRSPYDDSKRKKRKRLHKNQDEEGRSSRPRKRRKSHDAKGSVSATRSARSSSAFTAYVLERRPEDSGLRSRSTSLGSLGPAQSTLLKHQSARDDAETALVESSNGEALLEMHSDCDREASGQENDLNSRQVNEVEELSPWEEEDTRPVFKVEKIDLGTESAACDSKTDLPDSLLSIGSVNQPASSGSSQSKKRRRLRYDPKKAQAIPGLAEDRCQGSDGKHQALRGAVTNFDKFTDNTTSVTTHSKMSGSAAESRQAGRHAVADNDMVPLLQDQQHSSHTISNLDLQALINQITILKSHDKEQRMMLKDLQQMLNEREAVNEALESEKMQLSRSLATKDQMLEASKENLEAARQDYRALQAAKLYLEHRLAVAEAELQICQQIGSLNGDKELEDIQSPRKPRALVQNSKTRPSRTTVNSSSLLSESYEKEPSQQPSPRETDDDGSDEQPHAKSAQQMGKLVRLASSKVGIPRSFRKPSARGLAEAPLAFHKPMRDRDWDGPDSPCSPKRKDLARPHATAVNLEDTKTGQDADVILNSTSPASNSLKLNERLLVPLASQEAQPQAHDSYRISAKQVTARDSNALQNLPHSQAAPDTLVLSTFPHVSQGAVESSEKQSPRTAALKASMFSMPRKMAKAIIEIDDEIVSTSMEQEKARKSHQQCVVQDSAGSNGVSEDPNTLVQKSRPPLLLSPQTKRPGVETLLSVTRKFTSPRKATGIASPHFAVSDDMSPSKKRRREVVLRQLHSINNERYGLIQEEFAARPYELLVAVIFLNRTYGRSAIPMFREFIVKYPNVVTLANADIGEIATFLRPLGLYNQRASKLIAMAQTWQTSPPAKGRRFRSNKYPTLLDGLDVKNSEVVADDDPRQGAFEIAHLPGIGEYALDSWRIFCRDVLRGVAEDWNGKGSEPGFQPEWMRVVPKDKELRPFLEWCWLKEGYIWDPLTGDKRVADEAALARAVEGTYQSSALKEVVHIDSDAGDEDDDDANDNVLTLPAQPDVAIVEPAKSTSANLQPGQSERPIDRGGIFESEESSNSGTESEDSDVAGQTGVPNIKKSVWSSGRQIVARKNYS